MTKNIPLPSSSIHNNENLVEYVMKVTIRDHKSSFDQFDITQYHILLLEVILKEFPSIKIYNNNGQRLKKIVAFSLDRYRMNFRYHKFSKNKSKKQTTIFNVYHRIYSSVPISKLAKNKKVSKVLKKYNITIGDHSWTEEKIDIVNLGFFTEVDSRNQLSEELQGIVLEEISHKTRTPIHKIPQFKCCYIRPFVHHRSGRFITRSYDFQCQRKDAKNLVDLLKQTYKDSQKFVFHKLRHENISSYKKAISRQNQYLECSRVIPISGVTNEMMIYFHDDLAKLDGLVAIHRSYKTEFNGRWNLMTTKHNFKKLIPKIKKMLNVLIDTYVTSDIINPLFPSIGISFNQSSTRSRKLCVPTNKMPVSDCKLKNNITICRTDSPTITTCASSGCSIQTPGSDKSETSHLQKDPRLNHECVPTEIEINLIVNAVLKQMKIQSLK